MDQKFGVGIDPDISDEFESHGHRSEVKVAMLINIDRHRAIDLKSLVYKKKKTFIMIS